MEYLENVFSELFLWIKVLHYVRSENLGFNYMPSHDVVSFAMSCVVKFEHVYADFVFSRILSSSGKMNKFGQFWLLYRLMQAGCTSRLYNDGWLVLFSTAWILYEFDSHPFGLAL